MIWGSLESTGPQQHTGTSLVFIRCVVPEIEIFSLFQSGKTAFLEMELFFCQMHAHAVVFPPPVFVTCSMQIW